jgi:hypothetical protein
MLWLLGYPFRPRAALAAMYPERAPGVHRYDALPGHPLLACGADDHGRISDPARLLTYVTYLPTFIPERDAQKDAEALVDLLVGRASYCALGLYGDASPLSVTLWVKGELATIGSEVPAPAVLKVRWQGAIPKGHRLYLVRDGETIATTEEASFEKDLVQAGRYRIELGRDVPTFFFGTRHVRWIYTNQIVVLPSEA